MLWRYWLGSRKGIRPVKNWVVGYWRGYLPAARYRLAFGPADATAAHCLLLHASVISRSVLPFWYRLTQLVPDKGVLNGCGDIGTTGPRRSEKTTWHSPRQHVLSPSYQPVVQVWLQAGDSREPGHGSVHRCPPHHTPRTGVCVNGRKTAHSTSHQIAVSRTEKNNNITQSSLV